MSLNSNLVGQTIMDDLYIEEFIGSGGFGDVYKAYSRIGSQKLYFAVKHLIVPRCRQDYEECLRSVRHDAKAADTYFKELYEEILGEILLMVQLSKLSKNIVAYNHHNIIPPKEEFKKYEIFIKMELLTPLDDYCTEKSVTIVEFIQMGMDVASALEACHSKNVLHRDIKEANIFIDDEGVFKLGDFGLAKNLNENAKAKSNVGTSAYKAPEIFNPVNQYDKPVDIYSLGIVLYKVFNHGRLPFLPPFPEAYGPKTIDEAVLRRARGEELVAPVNAPEPLAKVILKACAPKPEDRYQTATEMKLALELVKSRLKYDELTIIISSPAELHIPDMESSRGKYFSSFGKVINKEEDYIHEELFNSSKNRKNYCSDNEKSMAEIDRQLWETTKNEGTEEAVRSYLEYEIDNKQFEQEARELLDKILLQKHVKPALNAGITINQLIDKKKKDEVIYSISVGDYLEFGKYINVPILWKCIKEDKDGVLLAAEYIICLKAYDAAESNKAESGNNNISKWGCADWTSSNLRDWLNSSARKVNFSSVPPSEESVLEGFNAYSDEPGFLYNFTKEERSIMVPVQHNNVEDVVFILSTDELQWIGNKKDDRIRYLKDMADNNYICSANNENGRWYWLRSSNISTSECNIIYDGELCICDAYVGGGGVVPVVKLKYDFFAVHPVN